MQFSDDGRLSDDGRPYMNSELELKAQRTLVSNQVEAIVDTHLYPDPGFQAKRRSQDRRPPS